MFHVFNNLPLSFSTTQTYALGENLLAGSMLVDFDSAVSGFRAPAGGRQLGL